MARSRDCAVFCAGSSLASAIYAFEQVGTGSVAAWLHIAIACGLLTWVMLRDLRVERLMERAGICYLNSFGTWIHLASEWDRPCQCGATQRNGDQSPGRG